ncbi:hypothetical protein HanXRQr2_Chr13g0576101 [Helianthus annuus]|uniref:Uncharacterized protein n=1 Tax=Helianthus annuus TaxID=4232 RepID=A0A9K3EF22_HELAN|nr:hypothetical protein HanXRQr2_Chr13g0576101 [Helianthus annuus]
MMLVDRYVAENRLAPTVVANRSSDRFFHRYVFDPKLIVFLFQDRVFMALKLSLNQCDQTSNNVSCKLVI